VVNVVAQPPLNETKAVALKWEASWESAVDPSGRAIATHRSAYTKD